MTAPTLDSIRPLIQDLQVSGRSVRVRFVCPRSGQSVSASHTLQAAGPTALSRVSNTVGRSLLWSLRSAVAQVIRRSLGYGIAGRVASDLAYSAMNQATRTSSQRSTTLSGRERDEATLQAFVSVQDQFVWDGASGGWVHGSAAKELLGGFQAQLSSHAVVHPYDREVLGRMLVELARADGRVSQEEAGWLTELLAGQGAVEDVARRPPLTTAELRAMSPGGVRTTALMLAWAMALVDEDLAQGEQQALQRFGQGLDLRPADQARARSLACTWMMDQALDRMRTWGGHDQHARQELYALAGRLGLSQQEAEEAEARFLRRSAR